jgi:hypothetical protein
VITAVVGTYMEVMCGTGACALESAPDKILASSQLGFITPVVQTYSSVVVEIWTWLCCLIWFKENIARRH